MLNVTQVVKKYPPFMGPRDALPFSQNCYLIFIKLCMQNLEWQTSPSQYFLNALHQQHKHGGHHICRLTESGKCSICFTVKQTCDEGTENVGNTKRSK